ncbi:hypothetical protein MP638_007093 [Amoeboaphelidium occidentale]|nr:hypothetical protein MP638_007093 [Amoeboaphelidium occidentale]
MDIQTKISENEIKVSQLLNRARSAQSLNGNNSVNGIASSKGVIKDTKKQNVDTKGTSIKKNLQEQLSKFQRKIDNILETATQNPKLSGNVPDVKEDDIVVKEVKQMKNDLDKFLKETAEIKRLMNENVRKVEITGHSLLKESPVETLLAVTLPVSNAVSEEHNQTEIVFEGMSLMDYKMKLKDITQRRSDLESELLAGFRKKLGVPEISLNFSGIVNDETDTLAEYRDEGLKLFDQCKDRMISNVNTMVRDINPVYIKENVGSSQPFDVTTGNNARTEKNSKLTNSLRSKISKNISEDVHGYVVSTLGKTQKTSLKQVSRSYQHIEKTLPSLRTIAEVSKPVFIRKSSVRPPSLNFLYETQPEQSSRPNTMVSSPKKRDVIVRIQEPLHTNPVKEVIYISPKKGMRTTEGTQTLNVEHKGTATSPTLLEQYDESIQVEDAGHEMISVPFKKDSDAFEEMQRELLLRLLAKKNISKKRNQFNSKLNPFHLNEFLANEYTEQIIDEVLQKEIKLLAINAAFEQKDSLRRLYSTSASIIMNDIVDKVCHREVIRTAASALTSNIVFNDTIRELVVAETKAEISDIATKISIPTVLPSIDEQPESPSKLIESAPTITEDEEREITEVSVKKPSSISSTVLSSIVSDGEVITDLLSEGQVVDRIDAAEIDAIVAMISRKAGLDKAIQPLMNSKETGQTGEPILHKNPQEEEDESAGELDDLQAGQIMLKSDALGSSEGEDEKVSSPGEWAKNEYSFETPKQPKQSIHNAEQLSYVIDSSELDPLFQKSPIQHTQDENHNHLNTTLEFIANAPNRSSTLQITEESIEPSDKTPSTLTSITSSAKEILKAFAEKSRIIQDAKEPLTLGAISMQQEKNSRKNDDSDTNPTSIPDFPTEELETLRDSDVEKATFQ